MSLSLQFVGWALLAAAMVWPLRDAGVKTSAPTLGWKWWLLVGAVLLIFRWPMLWVRHELNVDESQLIAGALTLRHDSVFWRSVDGSTAGPFDFYPLLVAAWTQGAASYAIARLLALACAWATVIFTAETLALMAGATMARVVALPALAFYAFTREPDFAHYSTEAVPVLLLAAAGYATVRQATTPSRANPWIVGLLLGAVPWAKLQGAPLAAVLGAFAVAQEISAARTRAVSALVIGAVLPSLAVAFVTVVTGQTEHALTAYFANAFAYVAATGPTFGEVAVLDWNNAVKEGQLALWLTGGIGFMLLAPVLAAESSVLLRRWCLAVAGLLVAAVVCVLIPRRPFCHYLLLVIWPFALATGAGLALAAHRTATAVSRRTLAIIGLFLVFTVLPQIADHVFGEDSFAGANAARPRAETQKLIGTLRDLTRPGDSLAVWGWRSSLYVEAGLRQATRQAHSEAQLFSSPRQPFFLNTYYDDITAANPPVFADAVGPHGFKFTDRAQAHEVFPPLRKWIAAHYTLVADLDGTRLYLRNDRLTSRTPPAATRP